MVNKELYDQYDQRLTELNHKINKLLYPQENWNNEEKMEQARLLQEEQRQIEYEIIRLELVREEPQPKWVRSEQTQKIMEEGLSRMYWGMINGSTIYKKHTKQSYEGHDFENYNGKTLTY